MKIKNSSIVLLLITFIVLNVIFFYVYSVQTDYSWPQISFENYAGKAGENINTALNIEIGGDKKIFTASLPAGSTAADLLKDIDGKNDIGLITKEFPGSGLFVEGLAGKNSDTKKNTYWFFYINGVSSQVGISQYKLKNSDTITFKYEEAKF
jgi:hypothetical protein